MIDRGKHSILGININAIDYEFAVKKVVTAAERKVPFAVSALAVHGVMTGFLDPIHARRLNGMDLVVPDGQPVRWALWWLYRQALPDRVCGPKLTLRIAEAFAAKGLSVYIYGSRLEVLQQFANRLQQYFPQLQIAGMEPSKFRRLNLEERKELVARIKASGANAVILGLGCPRQEVWAYEYRQLLAIPILAVGAAFDFHAGKLAPAPQKIQDLGLEWVFRLLQEPRRLWRRYIILNPLYLWHLGFQLLGWKKFIPPAPDGNEPIESFG